MIQIPQNFWEQRHYRFGLAGEGQADIIQRHLKRHQGALLNIGCGPQGRHVTNLATFCKRLIAVDKNSGMVRAASLDPTPSNVTFVVGDAHHLPFSAQSFDDIIALGLFAYVASPERVFTESNRVIRSCGRIMLTNAAARPKAPVVDAATTFGFKLIEEAEGNCPAASGSVKRRYLCVFEAP